MGIIEKRVSKDGQVRFRAKVRLRGVPVQTATFGRKTEANHWIQDTESAIRDRRYFHMAESKKHTLSELIDRYIENVLPRKPKSQKKQTQQLKWWKKKLGAYTLIDVTPELIAKCRDELLETTTRRKKKYSTASVNRYISAISHVFTIGIKEWAWVQDNPVKKIQKPKEPQGRSRYLLDGERKKLLDACKDSKNRYLYLVVVLSLSTGARQQEIWSMRWSQVDLERGFVTLTDTKNGECRMLFLTGLALELMKKHSIETNLTTRDGFVFPGSKQGTPMDFRTAWEGALRKAEIVDFMYHDLRHSAAASLAMNGATNREIAEVLGHKSLQMVKRYAHVSSEHTARVVASMNEAMFANAK